MRIFSCLVVLLLAGLMSVLAWPGPVLAQDAVATTKEAVKGVFTETERRVIDEYYRKIAARFPAGNQTSPQPADDDSDGKGRKGKKDKEQDKEKKAKGKKDKADLPPGLAKKDELPPGLQKRLEKNGSLPPGLQKRALPSDLAARLPAPRAGQERVVVDGDVVLVETATGKVLDILRDVAKSVPRP